MKKTSVAGLLGALPVGSIVSNTEVEEDIDGGAPGALSVGPLASTTDVEDDVDGGTHGGPVGGSDSIHH